MSFTQATFEFLADLEANNSKIWFDANRDRYEAHWKAPALAFIDIVSADMASLTPRLKAEARLNGSLRRINRDVRFSKDKSPYNARLHMIFWTGSHPNRSPAMHIVLNPKGVGYGAGHFGVDPKTLANYRDRIVDERDGDRLIDALAAATDAGCDMAPPDLARLPKGYQGDGKRGELLRYKGFVARTMDAGAPPKAIMGDAGPDWAIETTKALMPLIAWLSETPERA